MQQGVQVTRIDHLDSLLLVDHSLVNQVTCDLKSSLGSSLAVTGLKHVQLAVLDSELHILHVSVMVFQLVADRNELIVNFRHNLFQLCDLLRSADTCNHVLALCVHQELTHQLLLAGSRVTGKCYAGSGGLAHVAECHHLNVHCGTPGIRDIVVAAVYVRTGVVPGTEYSLDRAHQLLLRIGREILADHLLILSLELVSQYL